MEHRLSPLLHRHGDAKAPGNTTTTRPFKLRVVHPQTTAVLQLPGGWYVTNGAGHQYNGLTLEATRSRAYFQSSWTGARSLGPGLQLGFRLRFICLREPIRRRREVGPASDIPTHRWNTNLSTNCRSAKGDLHRGVAADQPAGRRLGDQWRAEPPNGHVPPTLTGESGWDRLHGFRHARLRDSSRIFSGMPTCRQGSKRWTVGSIHGLRAATGRPLEPPVKA